MRASLLGTGLLAATLAAGCAGPAGMRALQGAALQQALIGTWCNSVDGGQSCWALDFISADGRLRACGRQPDDGEPFDGSGTLQVDGDRLCYRVQQASESFWVRPGSLYCTRIVGVGPQQHVYEDLESKRRYTLTRVPPHQVTARAREAGCALPG